MRAHNLFLFSIFVSTVARLQAAQDDVTKIQTQVDALSKKEDAVLLAHIQSSVSAFKLERASKIENEDKTGIGADNDSANILVQSGEGSEGVQVKAEPVTMLSASASEISDTTSTLDLECEYQTCTQCATAKVCV